MVALRKLTEQADTGLAAIGQACRCMTDIQSKSPDTGAEVGGFGLAAPGQQAEGRDDNESQHNKGPERKRAKAIPQPSARQARCGLATACAVAATVRFGCGQAILRCILRWVIGMKNLSILLLALLGWLPALADESIGLEFPVEDAKAAVASRNYEFAALEMAAGLE